MTVDPVSLFKESVNLKITDLSRLELLNQVDDTFLLGKLDRFIIALDQHAMHERINLEMLERFYKHGKPLEKVDSLAIFTDFIEKCEPKAYTKVEEEIDLSRNLKIFQLFNCAESQEYFSEHGFDYDIDGTWLFIKKLPVVFGTKFQGE